MHACQINLIFTLNSIYYKSIFPLKLLYNVICTLSVKFIMATLIKVQHDLTHWLTFTFFKSFSIDLGIRVGGGGGGVLGLIFAGYVLLASQSPYPIIVYSVANYTPHLSHFWANK